MVAITRWNPMREMYDLTDRMNRLFGGHAGRGLTRDGEDQEYAGVWAPAVDVREREGGLELSVELPGIDPKDVDVSVENGVLSIRGERQFEKCEEGESYHRVERAYGSFERTFRLPSSYNAEKIEAKANHGVLTLSVPKREEAKPRSIKVKIN
jgi:HSP20 family protein